MKTKTFTYLTLIWLVAFLPLVNAQEVPRIALEMSELTPGLISIATNTQYFSDLAADLDLTAEQTTKLQDLVFQSVLQESRLTADLKIATAQIERLLTESDVDLKMLKQRLEERYHLAAQADFVHIQKALEALKLLTHEQHRKAFPAFRKLLQEKRLQSNKGNEQKM